MSACLSITVHNAFLPTQTYRIKDMLERKYFVFLYIDGEGEIKLRADRYPHKISIEPGAHTIVITRKPVGKTGLVDGMNKVLGGIVGGAVLGGAGAVMGSEFAGKVIGEDPLKNAKVLEFHEGETIACEVKPDFRGMPKVEWK